MGGGVGDCRRSRSVQALVATNWMLAPLWSIGATAVQIAAAGARAAATAIDIPTGRPNLADGSPLKNRYRRSVLEASHGQHGLDQPDELHLGVGMTDPIDGQPGSFDHRTQRAGAEVEEVSGRVEVEPGLTPQVRLRAVDVRDRYHEAATRAEETFGRDGVPPTDRAECSRTCHIVMTSNVPSIGASRKSPLMTGSRRRRWPRQRWPGRIPHRSTSQPRPRAAARNRPLPEPMSRSRPGAMSWISRMRIALLSRWMMADRRSSTWRRGVIEAGAVQHVELGRIREVDPPAQAAASTPLRAGIPRGSRSWTTSADPHAGQVRDASGIIEPPAWPGRLPSAGRLRGLSVAVRDLGGGRDDLDERPAANERDLVPGLVE